jgi:YgiT-type zinc finger domain-containing protein
MSRTLEAAISRPGGAEMPTHLTHCFHCGGSDLEPREVEELLSVADYVVRCKVPATVCLRCGERYFDPDTVRQFEDIRAQVRAGDLSGLRTAGALLEPAA